MTNFWLMRFLCMQNMSAITNIVRTQMRSSVIIWLLCTIRDWIFTMAFSFISTNMLYTLQVQMQLCAKELLCNTAVPRAHIPQVSTSPQSMRSWCCANIILTSGAIILRLWTVARIMPTLQPPPVMSQLSELDALSSPSTVSQ